MDIWVTRDKNGDLWGFIEEPVKFESRFFPSKGGGVGRDAWELPWSWYPHITFGNSPKRLRMEFITELE